MGAPRIDLISGWTNAFINGDMNIFQRSLDNTSATQRFGADRFNLFSDIATSFRQFRSDEGVTVADGATIPILKSQYIKAEATWAPSTSLRMGVQHTVEYQMFPWLASKRVKIGFWVKTNKAGIYSVNVRTINPTAGSYLTSFEISSAQAAGPSWVPVSFEVDISEGVTISGLPSVLNAGFVAVDIMLAAGPSIVGVQTPNTWVTGTTIGGTGLKAVTGQVNFFDSTANVIRMTGFRMVPIEYEGQEIDLWAAQQRSFAEELQLCQRYYQILDNGLKGASTSTTNVAWGSILQTEMRAAPAVALKTSGLVIYDEVGLGTKTSNTATSSGTNSSKGVKFDQGGYVGLTAGRSGYCVSTDAFSADAEI